MILLDIVAGVHLCRNHSVVPVNHSGMYYVSNPFIRALD